jgi:hypothetical protein
MPCDTTKRIVGFCRGIRASGHITLAMKRVGVPDHAMRSIPGYLVAASMLPGGFCRVRQAGEGRLHECGPGHWPELRVGLEGRMTCPETFCCEVTHHG